MKKLTTVLATIAFSVPLALAAPFEGKVTMKMSGPQGSTIPATYSIKPGLSRMDVEAQGHSMSMIMDQSKETVTVLIPEQKMYMVRPMPKPAADAGDGKSSGDASLEKTNEHEKILGYDATKYLAKTKDGTAEIWITDQLGTFMGLGGGGGNPFGGQRQARGGGAGRQAWEDAFRGKDAFPLRVTSTSADGKQAFKMEVTDIQKTSVDASLFSAPSDYHDMAEMMRGMGGMPGMRPPGN